MLFSGSDSDAQIAGQTLSSLVDLVLEQNQDVRKGLQAIEDIYQTQLHSRQQESCPDEQTEEQRRKKIEKISKLFYSRTPLLHLLIIF